MTRSPHGPLSLIAHNANAACWRIRALIAVLRARTTSREALRKRSPNRLLIVCHGNIYRSAFVASYLSQRLSSNTQLRSRGLLGPPGRPCPVRHVEMSLARGVQLSEHRSSVMETTDIEWADVIVIMDRGNWARLCRASVDPGRIVWLGALDSGPVEIGDPYRMDDAAAAAVLDRLVTCADGLAKLLGCKPHRGFSAP